MRTPRCARPAAGGFSYDTALGPCALVVNSPGRPGTLRLADLPVPDPLPGRVRVRVEACGLNPVDHRTTAASHADWSRPYVFGCDVVGTVDTLGDGVGQALKRRTDHVDRASTSSPSTIPAASKPSHECRPRPRPRPNRRAARVSR
ncbi:alcohol dehydrogenase catalytic domain-containing protein [Streptomyces sp. NPDC055722]